jgi:hypothetical protein
MKTIIVVLSLALAGCSFVLPRKHDPSMFDNLVEVKLAVDKLDCKNKEWNDTFYKVEKLKVYTSLRKDPQAKAVEELEVALKKAHASSNEKFCESVVKINRTRVEVITDAWRGR